MHVVPSRIVEAVETIKNNLRVWMTLSLTAALRTDDMLLVVSILSMSCSLVIIWPINIMDTGPRVVTEMPGLISNLSTLYSKLLQLSD